MLRAEHPDAMEWSSRAPRLRSGQAPRGIRWAAYTACLLARRTALIPRGLGMTVERRGRVTIIRNYCARPPGAGDCAKGWAVVYRRATGRLASRSGSEF